MKTIPIIKPWKNLSRIAL